LRETLVRWLLAGVVTFSTLAAGAAAAADHPKAVAIQADLVSHKIWTRGRTVADAVRQARIAAGPHDRVSPLPATPLVDGMTIAIRRAFMVRLAVGNRQRTFATAAVTVGEFLKETGALVRPRDRVFPTMDAGLWPGATVRIVRVETTIIAKEERLPFGRIARSDPTLPRGMTRVVQPGQSGAQVRRIAVTTADGVVIDRQVIGVVTLRSPQDQILQVGTKRVFASRGEFAGKEMMMMEATAYAPWPGKGVDGTTAIGLRAGYGVVAVDPSVIPLGSRLFIEGYGMAIAGDTGGAIKGNRIDLGYNTPKEAYKFGRRRVRVYIVAPPQGAAR
jgi:uncharacterized protein YabE (DUF348 family)